MLDVSPPEPCLGYLITLLCDELTAMDNAEIQEEPPALGARGALGKGVHHLGLADNIQLIRNAQNRLTKEDFLGAFGDLMGTHIYRKFLTYDSDLLSLSTQVDSGTYCKLCSLIETIGK